MIAHAFLEGFKNLIRSFWISATAISVIFITLATVMLVSALTTIFGFSIRQFDDQIAIVAFIQPDSSQEQIEAIQSRLSQIPEVKEVRYVDDQTARRELEEDSQIAGSLIQTLRDSNIGLDLDYFNITPTSSESYAVALEKAGSEEYADGIDEVRGSQEFIDALQRIYDYTRYGGFGMVVVFTVISILVLINILRITIYNHKQEIEIMRLVGATNNYIRGPFIAEGAMYIIISGLVTLAIFIPTIQLSLPWIQEWFRIIDPAIVNSLLLQMYLSFAIVIIVATAAGSATAYYATQKYLNL